MNKGILAILAACLLVAVPLQASADTVFLHVAPNPTENAQGHHLRSEIIGSGAIGDSLTFMVANMSGQITSTPVNWYAAPTWMSNGLYVTQAGIWAYIYYGGPAGTVICSANARTYFNYHGCILSLTGLTLTNAQRLTFEDDYYVSPYNVWEFFVQDQTNAYQFIGKIPTTTDYMTGVMYEDAFTYPCCTLPTTYVQNGIFVHPMTWPPGTNWADWSTLLTISSYANAFSGETFCPGIFSVIVMPWYRVWAAGSSDINTNNQFDSGVCSGAIA